MRVSYSLPLILVLAACSDSSEPSAVPPTFAVSPASQWAGGTVLVRSQFFEGLDSLPPITAAGIAMVTARIDDSTLLATLPSFPTQTAAIEVIDGATSYPVGTVKVFGFRARTSTSKAISFEPVVVPTVDGPLAIGGIHSAWLGGPTGVVNLRTAQLSELPGVGPVNFISGHGVGATADPTRMILRDSLGVIGEWQIIPSVAYRDTVPVLGGTPRNLARLSDSVWLITYAHATTVVRGSLPRYDVAIEDPWRFTLSPAADRAILSAWYGANAVVFQMSTGDTLFRLPVHSVGGAAFTNDGNKLYVASGQASLFQGILAADARTGAVSASTPFEPAVVAQDLGLNTGGSLAFVVVSVENAPEVLVYQTPTLTLVGRLRAPFDVACSFPDYDDAIAVDDGSSTIFALNGTNGAALCIWEFDMLP